MNTFINLIPWNCILKDYKRRRIAHYLYNIIANYMQKNSCKSPTYGHLYISVGVYSNLLLSARVLKEKRQ